MSDVQVMQLGGVSTYSAPSMTNDTPVASPLVQSGVGTVQTFGSGGSQSSGHIEVNASDLDGGHTNFLATARNGFFPAQGNINADSVVDYQGMEISVGQLLAMGVVQNGPNGYEVVNQVAASQGGNGDGNNNDDSKKDQQLPPGTELFSNEVESQVATAIDPVPQAIYDSSLALALEGGLDAINFNDLGYQSGVTPEEARTRAESVVKAFTDQANSIAKASGLENPQDVWNWAAENRNEQFMAARRDMAFGRNTAALKEIVADYYRSVPPTQEALQRGGYQTRTGTNGELLAFIQGSWQDVSAAAQAGLI